MTPEQPDIEIGAVVKAKRVRFRKKPQADVEVHGDPGVEGGSGSGSARENLPDTVEPGVTYRDVRVTWRAAATLDPNKARRQE